MESASPCKVHRTGASVSVGHCVSAEERYIIEQVISAEVVNDGEMESLVVGHWFH